MCLKLTPRLRPPAPARREGGVRREVARETAPGLALSSVCSPSWTPGPPSPGPTSQPRTQAAVTPAFCVTLRRPHSSRPLPRARRQLLLSFLPPFGGLVLSSPRPQLWGSRDRLHRDSLGLPGEGARAGPPGPSVQRPPPPARGAVLGCRGGPNACALCQCCDSEQGPHRCWWERQAGPLWEAGERPSLARYGPTLCWVPLSLGP